MAKSRRIKWVKYGLRGKKRNIYEVMVEIPEEKKRATCKTWTKIEE
jgi:hypothetical protein